MTQRRSPSLAGFLFRNAAIGFAAGVLFGVLLVGADVGGLRNLVLQSDSGWIGGFVLCYSLGFTFAAFSCGAAVMRLGSEETKTQGGHPIGLRLVLIPIRVRQNG